jgi:serine/threonine protein kinase
MSDVVCPNGHWQIRSNARFCAVCGAPIATTVAQSLLVPTGAVCVNGHPQKKAGAKFCYICGAAVTASFNSQPLPDPANGVCLKGHAQVRSGARFCYLCGAAINLPPVLQVPSGPVFNGRYAVVTKIGEGGMGSTIYKVEDLQMGRRLLAVKEIDELLLEPPGDRPKVIDAFRREARLLQQLDHPNVIKAYEFFQMGTKYYMVMDLVQGRTLEKILESSPGGFPEARVLTWAEQLASALDYLHHQQPPIIYRDMKPANVMIEDGTSQVRLLDFGIAREFKGGKKKSDTIKFGTAGYAPPEQYGTKGVETSPASDVYALAAMLHQLLSGEDPTQNPFSFDFFILGRPPISASKRVIDALQKALDKEVAKRFATMADFGAALLGHPMPAVSGSGTPRQDQALNRSTSNGSLQLSDSQLDFGKVEKGSETSVAKTFTVTSSGGTVQIAAAQPWLIPMPTTASSGSVVRVVVETSRLPLAGRQVHVPNLWQFTRDRLKRIPGLLWLVISVALLIAASVPGIWRIPASLVVGGLGLVIGVWLIGRLIPHLIVQPTDLNGQLTVTDGPVQKSLTVHVRAVPSAWRIFSGWLSLLVVVGLEASVVIGLVLGIMGAPV